MRRLWILLVAALWVTGAVSSGSRVTVLVTDFSRGMVPVLAPYNSAQDISYYNNFISNQPQGTHLRYGYVGLLPDPAGAVVNDTTTALSVFAPTDDSSYILYTASGLWYGNQIGERIFRTPTAVFGTAPEISWLNTFRQALQIRPFPAGDSLRFDSGSAIITGKNTRFIRDVMVGDTVICDTFAKRAVVAVYSDTKIEVNTPYVLDTVFRRFAAYTLQRVYDRSAGPPYLLSAGNFAYSGNVATPPQVIYQKENTLYLREFGIVDSFYIDTIYNFSGRLKTIDTSAGGGDTVITNANPLKAVWYNASGDSVVSVLDERVTWDTIPGSGSPKVLTSYLRGFQVVSRRKSWLANEWRQSGAGASEAFYVRLGVYGSGEKYNTRYFTIRANDDTSIYLNALYLDNGPIDSIVQGVDWIDSLYKGRGTTTADTLQSSDIRGTWGYIYATAGAPVPIVQDTATENLVILGRGAVCYTIDSTFPLDSSDFINGMYFIRLTAGDVAFPAIENQISRIREIEIIVIDAERAGGLADPTLADDDSLLYTVRVWAVYKRPEHGSTGWDRVSDYFPTRDEARQAIQDGGFVGDDYKVMDGEEWHIRRGRNTFQNVDAEFVQEYTTFPIRYVQTLGDTVFFICASSPVPNDPNSVTTANWEIVQARIPRFRRMDKLFSGSGLLGWGDTLAPTTISISPGYQPWRFSAQSDVSIGDPSEPLTAVTSFDDRIVAFKLNRIWDVTNGAELSYGLGAVGPNAVCVQDKSLYFCALDGLYKMDRRDFAGYSITPISRPVDPIFQNWSGFEYGNNTVPFSVERTNLGQTSVIFNPFDHHLWVWVSDSLGVGLRKVLTYDIERNIWDGYHNIPVGSAIQTTLRDTSRILFGSVDSAYVLGFSYKFHDAGKAIDGGIVSKPFVIRDDAGRKLRSRLESVGITSRTSSIVLDTAWLILATDGATDGTQKAAVEDTFRIVPNATMSNFTKYYFPSKSLIGREWVWKLRAKGTAAGGLFMPIEFEMTFIAVEDQ